MARHERKGSGKSLLLLLLLLGGAGVALALSNKTSSKSKSLKCNVKVTGNIITFNAETTAYQNPSYFWDFGDKVGTSIQKEGNYTYSKDGQYAVSVSVTEGGDKSTLESCTDQIIVKTGVPADTHKACSGGSCIDVAGAGKDECSATNPCPVPGVSHKECDPITKKCIVVNTAGDNKCTLDGDCPGFIPTHFECDGVGNCFEKAGAGDTLDQCKSKCPKPAQTHFECDGAGNCIEVVGPGDTFDQCKANCIPPLLSHLECNEKGKCLTAPGEGPDKCTADGDCPLPGTTHWECAGAGGCVEVNGVGPTKAECEAVCPGVLSHKSCVNGKCLNVVGIGLDQCTADGECFQKKCKADNTCGDVAFSGDPVNFPDICSINNDCALPPEGIIVSCGSPQIEATDEVFVNCSIKNIGGKTGTFFTKIISCSEPFQIVESSKVTIAPGATANIKVTTNFTFKDVFDYNNCAFVELWENSEGIQQSTPQFKLNCCVFGTPGGWFVPANPDIQSCVIEAGIFGGDDELFVTVPITNDCICQSTFDVDLQTETGNSVDVETITINAKQTASISVTSDGKFVSISDFGAKFRIVITNTNSNTTQTYTRNIPSNFCP